MKISKLLMLIVFLSNIAGLEGAAHSSTSSTSTSSSSPLLAETKQKMNDNVTLSEDLMLQQELQDVLSVLDVASLAKGYTTGWHAEQSVTVDGSYDSALVLPDNNVAFVDSAWFQGADSNPYKEAATRFWSLSTPLQQLTFSRYPIYPHGIYIYTNIYTKTSYCRMVLANGKSVIVYPDLWEVDLSDADKEEGLFKKFVMFDILSGEKEAALHLPKVRKYEDLLGLTNISNHGVVSSWKDGTLQIQQLADEKSRTIKSDLPVAALCWTGRAPEKGDLAGICFDAQARKLYFRCWNSDLGTLVQNAPMEMPFKKYSCPDKECTFFHESPNKIIWLGGSTFVAVPDSFELGSAKIMGFDGKQIVTLQNLLAPEDKKRFGAEVGTYDVALLPDGRLLTISGTSERNKRTITVWRYGS